MKITIAIAVTLLLLPAASLMAQIEPTITSISPTWELAGSGSFTLTVTGTNYYQGTTSAGSVVRWNGSDLETAFISPTQLQATVDSALIANPGTAIIDVTNYSEVESNQVSFLIATLLTITTGDPLPSVPIGSPYSIQLTATGGNSPYRNWRVVEGGLPPGMNLDSATGIISGTATAAGSFMFQVNVDDSAYQSATRVLHLNVNAPPLSITSVSPLPEAMAGTAYSQQLSATGGAGTYSWSVSSGTLPTGLTLSAAGVLSGIPTQGGSFAFEIRVTDSAENRAAKQFDLQVKIPALPSISITGLTDAVQPATQPSFNVSLSKAYTLPITGTVVLEFAPGASVDDPAIQFSSGGRTLEFTIAAGQMTAFPSSAQALQTGTVAGTITLRITRLSSAGQSILPSPSPQRSAEIVRAAPAITSVHIVRTASGFDVQIIGYSTSRQATQAVFTFSSSSGGYLLTTQLTVPVESEFGAWYTSASSAQYGSTFLYTQPFTVEGDIKDLASLAVTLTNSAGTSLPVSVTF